MAKTRVMTPVQTPLLINKQEGGCGCHEPQALTIVQCPLSWKGLIKTIRIGPREPQLADKPHACDHQVLGFDDDQQVLRDKENGAMFDLRIGKP